MKTREEKRSQIISEFLELQKQMMKLSENGTYLDPIVLDYHSTRLDTLRNRLDALK